MWNTCSIGRRWKPREGWSRPVLTGERGTLSNPCLVGWVSSCGGFLVGWQGALFLVVTATMLVRRFGSRPLSGSRTATIGIVAGSVAGRSRGGLAVVFGFAVVMAQVRRPVPFRTRKLRPGRGDGTALERVWESSTPPHSTSEDPPVEPRGGVPGGSFSCLFARGSRRASRPGNPFSCFFPGSRFPRRAEGFYSGWLGRGLPAVPLVGFPEGAFFVFARVAFLHPLEFFGR